MAMFEGRAPKRLRPLSGAESVPVPPPLPGPPPGRNQGRNCTFYRFPSPHVSPIHGCGRGSDWIRCAVARHPWRTPFGRPAGDRIRFRSVPDVGGTLYMNKLPRWLAMAPVASTDERAKSVDRHCTGLGASAHVNRCDSKCAEDAAAQFPQEGLPGAGPEHWDLQDEGLPASARLA